VSFSRGRKKGFATHRILQHANIIEITIFEDALGYPCGMDRQIVRCERVVPKEPTKLFADLLSAAGPAGGPRLRAKLDREFTVQCEGKFSKRVRLESRPTVLVARERSGRSSCAARDLRKRQPLLVTTASELL